jgi:hypothetical protein
LVGWYYLAIATGAVVVGDELPNAVGSEFAVGIRVGIDHAA